MSYTKFFLTPEQTKYIFRNPAKYWTNEYSQITWPQYHVEVEDVTYWLDIYDDGELICIAYADKVWSKEVTESDCADILEPEEYAELQIKVRDAIQRNMELDEQLRIAFAKMDSDLGCVSEVSVDNLKNFINKLNAIVVEGASK